MEGKAGEELQQTGGLGLSTGVKIIVTIIKAGTLLSFVVNK